MGTAGCYPTVRGQAGVRRRGPGIRLPGQPRATWPASAAAPLPRLGSPLAARRVQRFLAGLLRPACLRMANPRCRRELCDPAGVNMGGTREPSRSYDGSSPLPWSPAHSPAAQDSCKRPAEARLRRSSEIRKPARRWQHQARCPGLSPPGPRDCAACCRDRWVPAFRRRSLWLDQASARQVLAVAPRRSSEAPTTVTMSSRCSPEPYARSRRLPGAAA